MLNRDRVPLADPMSDIYNERREDVTLQAATIVAHGDDASRFTILEPIVGPARATLSIATDAPHF
jgi:hypothetical protein